MSTDDRELRAAIREVLDELTLHTARIQQLIERVEAMLDAAPVGPAPPSERRARIHYGGGHSPLAPGAHGVAPVDDVVAVDAREPSPRAETGQSSTRDLIIVSELAQAGYSPEEIANRLRTRWGAQAAAVLRDATE